MRRDATYSEKVLWQDLRNRKMRGLKFYRQFSVGNFILDFYCPEICFAIELDGISHAEPCVIENDRRKDLYLQRKNSPCPLLKRGGSLLRITDDELLGGGRDILARIGAMIDTRRTPPAPSFQEGVL